jgi:hypothetical protein
MNEALHKLGHHVTKYAPAEQSVMDDLCNAFESSNVALSQRLQTFPRHVRRQDIARFLVKHELFKLSMSANGSIVECGVFAGGGLASWLHFSSIYEPYTHTRRIIGFDTFLGFPAVHEKDKTTGASEHTRIGAFQSSDNILDELRDLTAIHDTNRPLGHIPKIELVAGDATMTIPSFIKQTPHFSLACSTSTLTFMNPQKLHFKRLFLGSSKEV